MKTYFAALGLMFLLASRGYLQQPNIIVIVADDMGYADAGFTGSKDILTPNLDEIADNLCKSSSQSERVTWMRNAYVKVREGHARTTPIIQNHSKAHP